MTFNEKKPFFIVQSHDLEHRIVTHFLDLKLWTSLTGASFSKKHPSNVLSGCQLL